MVGIRRAIAVGFAAMAFSGSPIVQTASAHPLHTSLAELVYDERSKTISISLRVFVDDFTAASNSYATRLASRSSAASTVSPLITYARSAFIVADASGKPIILESCGGKRVGELMWLCFRGKVNASPKGFRVLSRVLFETYKDQINVVQATIGGRKSNLLFTPGDRDKTVR